MRGQRAARSLLAAARTAQVAYGRLALHPRLGRGGARVGSPVAARNGRANLRARRELRAIRTPAPKGLLLAWRIQAPAPARELLTWYHRAGRRFGVGWQYLRAINLIETTFGKIHGLSVVGRARSDAVPAPDLGRVRRRR